MEDYRVFFKYLRVILCKNRHNSKVDFQYNSFRPDFRIPHSQISHQGTNF